VGAVEACNTHPFQHGRWLFAHNGTVARFRRVASVRRALEAEIAPAHRALLAGDTDSERCFLLFLTLLEARVPSARPPALEDVHRALGETVTLVRRLADRRPAKPSSLNLLVTNGELLAVCRRGRTLQVAPHIATSGLFAIASEPIGRGPWRELPENGFIGIDAAHRILEAPLRPASDSAAA
jgi:predicted glutamine amidotransferase